MCCTSKIGVPSTDMQSHSHGPHIAHIHWLHGPCLHAAETGNCEPICLSIRPFICPPSSCSRMASPWSTRTIPTLPDHSSLGAAFMMMIKSLDLVALHPLPLFTPWPLSTLCHSSVSTLVTLDPPAHPVRAPLRASPAAHPTLPPP